MTGSQALAEEPVEFVPNGAVQSLFPEFPDLAVQAAEAPVAEDAAAGAEQADEHPGHHHDPAQHDGHDHGDAHHDAGHGGHGEYMGHLYADEFGWYPPQEHGPWYWEFTESITGIFDTPHVPLVEVSESLFSGEHFHFENDLSNEPLGVLDTPDRPDLVFEMNEGFLKPGPMGDEDGEVVTPFGAVWRPSLWVFGSYRAHAAYRSQEGLNFTELSHRLNLFTQLNLTGTERLVVQLRPLDDEINRPNARLGREFNSYDLQDGDWIDGWNAEPNSLFFEGDFGELFPNLDPYDSMQLDYGFTVGRQPLLAQQGLLINEDMLDAVTVTRNTLSGNGNLNLRATGVFAWNRVSRHSRTGGPFNDANGKLFALLTESDYHWATVNADVVYVDSEDQNIGNMVSWGLSAVQRLHGYHHHYNSAFHILGSHPTNDETTAAGQGELLVHRLSWTPHGGLDVIYLNGFWGIDQYTSAARGPLMGGPLGGSIGILWAHTGLGRYGPPIFNQVADSAGGALGYQIQLDGTRSQVTFELGGRADTKDDHDGVVAGGLRYQQACGQHTVWIFDTFVGKRESQRSHSGARIEMLVKF